MQTDFCLKCIYQSFPKRGQRDALRMRPTKNLTTDLLLWPMCGFAHGIKSLGALMFKDTCTVGKMLRSNHGTWAPLSPASWDARVTNDLCKKRGHCLLVGILSLKKKGNKKAWGKFNLCFLVQIFGSDRMILLFYQVLVSVSLTHTLSHFESIRHTHSSTHLIIHSLFR